MYKIIASLMNKKNIHPIYADSDHYWERYPQLYEGVYPITSDVLNNEVEKFTLCDNSHARQKYGWIPTVSFEEGLRNTVNFSVDVLQKINFR